MSIHVIDLLQEQELNQIRLRLNSANWKDGKESAGEQAREVKNNLQLSNETEQALFIRKKIIEKLNQNSEFFSLTLPKKIFTPKVNCYDSVNCSYGPHIDNAVRLLNSQGEFVRTDISCTVFLNSPDEYDGGELSFTLGDTKLGYKLKAGQALLYPGNTLHEVTAVTRGKRYACFTWIESLIRNSSQREILSTLDKNLIRLRNAYGETSETTAMTGVYHNLLREWSDT